MISLKHILFIFLTSVWCNPVFSKFVAVAPSGNSSKELQTTLDKLAAIGSSSVYVVLPNNNNIRHSLQQVLSNNKVTIIYNDHFYQQINKLSGAPVALSVFDYNGNSNLNIGSSELNSVAESQITSLLEQGPSQSSYFGQMSVLKPNYYATYSMMHKHVTYYQNGNELLSTIHLMKLFANM